MRDKVKGCQALKFEDVEKCRDIAAFSSFVSRYIDERGLKGEEAKRAFWALFHRWKGSLRLTSREG